MACNERCPFCNVPAEDYEKLTPPQHELDQQLDDFVQSGARTLTISGGEPTLLRKRLLALVRAARDRGIPLVEIQTNATLIDPAYATALADAGTTSAFVSLLSHNSEHHDVLAGLPGAFDKCLRGIDSLVAAGVRVALNPVLARQTQGLFAQYVSFVADRWPAVRSISVSAVQPHGRASRGTHPEELLPDYDVLAPQIRAACVVARDRGIELLNPYCGLPLCVGWADDPERSVEAIEAAAGGWRPTPGVENRGDKRQGAPCLSCAWRTRCGGAWHAVWELRGGRGLAPPHRVRAPWAGGSTDAGQAVIDLRQGIDAGGLERLGSAVQPTVWAWVVALRSGDAARLYASGCTDLAAELDPRGLSTGRAPPATLHTLRELQQLLRRGTGSTDAGRLRVHLRLAAAAPADLAAAAAWATRAGVDRVVRRRVQSEATPSRS
jgi:MoaA/NifB/PqqE/SkfB family radical SAM enzyme